ncbi:MAG: alpha-2-macroglobulin, partial [Treponema sp.]|nr:alpha-2-macroglobulin [Treponema sp.]
MRYGRFLRGLALYFAVVFFAPWACKPHDTGEARPTAVFSGSLTVPGRAAEGLGAYRIAYYEAAEGAYAEIDGAGGVIGDTGGPFTMVDYGPRGELPQEVKKPSLYVVFSQPVIPLAKLGDPVRWEEGAPNPGLLTVDPPLPGVFRWYGTKLLAFEPDAASLPQRQYTVTVSERLRSLGGKALEGERSFWFETERLSVLHWRLGDGEYSVRTWDAPPEDARRMVFIFSYPVNLTEIRRWLRVSIRGGASGGIPFQVSRPENPDEGYELDRQVLITVEEELPSDADVDITLLQGARSEEDWLGTRAEEVFSFHTLLPFKLDNVSVRSESSPRTEDSGTIPIMLEFSHPVDPESAAGVF